MGRILRLNPDFDSTIMIKFEQKITTIPVMMGIALLSMMFALWLDRNGISEVVITTKEYQELIKCK